MFKKYDARIQGYIFAGLASLFMTANFVLSKMILRDVNPETSSVYFFGFGAVSSFFLLVFTKRLSKVREAKNLWKQIAVLSLFGSVGSVLWFYGIDSIGPSLTAFLVRFVVVFAVLWGVLFLKEKFNKVEALGMIIAVIGALFLTYTSENFAFLGGAIVLAATFIFSINQLIVKIYIKKIDPFVLNHLRVSLVTLILFSYTFFSGKLETPTKSVLLLSFIAGTLGAAIGITFFYKALDLADLSKVNIIRTIDPFVVVLYAFLFLQEIPTLNQLLGGSIIVFGVIILIMSRKRPKLGGFFNIFDGVYNGIKKRRV